MGRQKLDKTNLGYLDVSYQYKLVKYFIEDSSFFENIVSIVDPNAFTEPALRNFVGIIKDKYVTNSVVPSYEMISIIVKSKAKTTIDIEECDALIHKLKFETSYEGNIEVKDIAVKFFKQQNMIKVANKILDIAGKGDIDRYEECQQLFDDAANAGQEEDFGFSIFDLKEKALSNDYTVSIPTGIKQLDDHVGGGLDKGKLGLLIAPAGFGKAQPLSARILTPNGYKFMRDIQIGDEVLGRDGQPHKVSGVFPQGKRPIYRVTLSNGTSCECDIEHLWNVNSLNQRNRKKYIPGLSKHKNDKYYTPDNSFKTMSLRQIIDKGIIKRGNRLNFKLPMPQPVVFKDRPLFIDPYLMGYCLGDGNMDRWTISVGSNDKDTVENLLMPILGNDLHMFYHEKKDTWSFDIAGKTRKVLSENVDYHKSDTKYIMDDFLYNTIEKRIALLQGLMDSDGCANKNGSCEFASKSRVLAEQVQWLVRSLGGFASLAAYDSGYYSEKYQKYIDCDKRYRVTISLCNPSIPLFRMKRKQDKVNYRTKYADSLFISNVEYVREDDAQCIMVDSEEHLYLTEDFIVTHNTSFTTAINAYAATYKCDMNNHEGYKVLQIYFEDDDVDITRKHFARITQTEARFMKRLDIANRDEIEHKLMSHPDKDMIGENLRLKHFRSGTKTASDIEVFIKKLINRGFKPDLVTIDYFECIAPEKGGHSSDSQWVKEGVTMRKFENMAKDLNCAIWIATQGNKDSINSPDVVRMDQAGGSIMKVQVAQFIISIARALEDIDRNKAVISILKNRSGKSGKIFNNVKFNNGTCTISCDEVEEFDDGLTWKEESTKRHETDIINKSRDLMQQIRNEENTEFSIPNNKVEGNFVRYISSSNNPTM